MRIVLVTLVILSLAQVGLLFDLRQQVVADRPAPADASPPASPDAPPEHGKLGAITFDPEARDRILDAIKDWPRRPDGTMPPR